MIVFVAFIAIVLSSIVLQWQTKRWQLAAGIPCLVFIALIVTDILFPEHGLLAFTLGIPMIFFASLLGCYVYETRLNPNRHDELESQTQENQPPKS